MELVILDTGGSLLFKGVHCRERDKSVKEGAIETSFQLQCHLSVAVCVLWEVSQFVSQISPPTVMGLAPQAASIQSSLLTSPMFSLPFFLSLPVFLFVSWGQHGRPWPPWNLWSRREITNVVVHVSAIALITLVGHNVIYWQQHAPPTAIKQNN